MLGSSDTEPSSYERRWNMLLYALIVIETFLVALALVPAQLWTRILVGSSNAALYGPFRPIIAPIITALLYLLPSVIGLLCRSGNVHSYLPLCPHG